MSYKHGEAGGPNDHAEDRQPHISHANRRVQAIPNTQHVAHGLKESVGVLLSPGVILQERERSWGEEGAGVDVLSKLLC